MGVAVLNDKAIPFDLAASNLNVELHYISSTDHYGATIDLANLRTKMATQPEVESRLHLVTELGRDMAELKSFDFATGANSHLSATALINHFNKPEWQTSLNGNLDLKQIGYLGNIDGFTAGNVELECMAATAKYRRRWRSKIRISGSVTTRTICPHLRR